MAGDRAVEVAVRSRVFDRVIAVLPLVASVPHISGVVGVSVVVIVAAVEGAQPSVAVADEEGASGVVRPVAIRG